MTPRALALALYAALSAPPALATEALVLSGGGARGLAHIGAVVGYERSRHDADIVVGTSMGAIVGGFYAAGYSPAEIEATFRAQDWREMFTPFPLPTGPSRAPRYPVLRFQAQGGRSFTTPGYVPDWRINRKLTHYLFGASARARGDFDRLPRRFRSMTGDLESGTLVALGSGDLARAIRASMAASGFFAPVRWNERLLTDGGIADYLPVDEPRRLGAEMVVAVDVLRPPPVVGSAGAIAVARRTVELMTMHVRREVTPPDVLILPRIPEGIAPYTYPVDPSPVIQAGLEASIEALTDTLGPGAPPGWRVRAPEDSTRAPEDPAAIRPDGDRALRARARAAAPAELGTLAIEEVTGPLAAFLNRAFAEAAPGRFREARILTIVDRLYATGLFDGIWVSVEDSSLASGPALVVRTEDRGPVSLSGAVGYDNDRGGRLWASLRRLGALGAHPVETGLEFSVDGVELWGAAPIRIARRDGNAWTGGAWFGESEAPFFPSPADPGNPETRRAGGWLGFEARRIAPDLGASLLLRGESIDADLGPEGGSYGASVRAGVMPPLVVVAGTPVEISADVRAGRADYWSLRAKGSVARRFGSVLAAPLVDVTGVSKAAPLDVIPAAGNEGIVPGLRTGERRGRLRAIAGLDLASIAPFGATVRLRLRGGLIADEARAPGAGAGGALSGAELHAPLIGRAHTWLGGAGLGALWWTPFGRIEAAVEAGTLGDRRFVVALGPDF